METTIVVQVDFYATVQSAFGVKSMRVQLNPPATVAQLLETICTPDRAREKILDPSGEIKNEITLLRNGRNIRFLNGPETEMRHGDTIAIFPFVAGG